MISNIFSIHLIHLIQLKKLLRNIKKHPSISIINKKLSSVDKEAAFCLKCLTSDDISKDISNFSFLLIGPSLMILKRQWFIQLNKKDCKTEKPNYRLISILPNLSKIYGRLFYEQMYTYFNKSFPKACIHYFPFFTK